MVRGKKHWLLMLTAVVLMGGLLGVPHLFAASSGYTPQEVPNVPPEWKNLPLVTELKPDLQCEVKLDRVMVISHPDGTRQTVRISGHVSPSSPPVRFKLSIDPVRRTYRTVQVPLTGEMRQRLEVVLQSWLDKVEEDPELTDEMRRKLEGELRRKLEGLREQHPEEAVSP